MSRCRGRRRHFRVARLLEHGLDTELDHLGLRLRHRLGARADDVDGPLEVPGRFEIRDEIGYPDRRGALAFDHDLRAGLLQLRKPQHRRQRTADLIQHVHRAGLPFAQLLDQHDALLQLRFPLLELLDLLDHRMQPRRLLLRGGDFLVELHRIVVDRPVAPADGQPAEHQYETAADRQLLADGAERDGLLLRAIALRREQVDANHRSPTRRSARPTATAAVGMAVSGSSTPNFCGSKLILRNGSNDSTVVPNRSRSASAKPSTRDAPPLSTTRSMRSDDAVALKKSNVFWISRRTFSVIACSTGLTSSKVAPSTVCPFFSCSADSKGRFNSFCTASV